VRLAELVAAGLLARLPADADAAVVRRGGDVVVGVAPDALVVADGADALSALDTLGAVGAEGRGAGTWVGWCAFELGRSLERIRPGLASDEPAALADVVFARFDAWAVVGADGAIALEGEGAGSPLLERAVLHPVPFDPVGSSGSVALTGPWHSSLDRDDFESRVEVIREHLRAGDCYQVNLTRRLGLDEALDPVALFSALARNHDAPYTGLLRVTVRGRPVSIVCASPERYLSWDGPRVETRPIKGTAADPGALVASAKDRAENVMIVDLARNDLGRVCETGSVNVAGLCEVEEHPGLYHLVSTVRGTLRPEIGVGRLVAATFPPASVTGAPKPRVLQIIEDLEPVRRGAYCGAFGWVDPARGAGDLAVAIRTFTIVDDRTELGTGAGIVADSDPGAEWDETELKASRLLALAGAPQLVTT
jgi:para-aminobenzoate synthetase component 1